MAARSGWFRTPAFPAGSGPDYVNGAVALAPAGAEAVLERLQAVEPRRAAAGGALGAAGLRPRPPRERGSMLPDAATVRDWMAARGRGRWRRRRG